MPTVLWVALGGALGSAARYGVNVWSGRALGADFPWHTLIVNIVGCFVMGALTTAMALKFDTSQNMRLFLTTGILGGFTTFSAFALDFAFLIERRDIAAASGYVLATVAFTLIGVFAGLAFGRMISA